MSELLPCPFCGGKAHIKRTPDYGSEKPRLYVYCCVCGVETPRIARTRKEAIAAWNRRTGKGINVTTNADRIRSMSDEELARFLGDEPPYFATYKQYIDWLRKPIESEVEESEVRNRN